MSSRREVLNEPVAAADAIYEYVSVNCSLSLAETYKRFYSQFIEEISTREKYSSEILKAVDQLLNPKEEVC